MLALDGVWDELESLLLPVVRAYRSRVHELDVHQKPDQTLLSEADIAVEELIVATIRSADPSSAIVAEEGTGAAEGALAPAGPVWVIDPIDGTAEFVDPGRREFCSVVCLLDGTRRPIGAFVLAPEIGRDRGAVCVRLAGPGASILVNGDLATRGSADAASVTRSAGTSAYPFEDRLSALGLALKTRTTSQTLDMVRASVDLTPYTEPTLGSFGLFYRERQKVWDGAAGMCLALASGLRVTDRRGRARSTVDIALDVPEPTFESVLVGTENLVREVLAITAPGAGG